MARYLLHTRTYGLVYGKGNHILHAQSDADFASCPDTRTSNYGNAIYYGGNIIAWKARKIKTVVLSTCETEFIAASNTVAHMKWLRHMILELVPGQKLPTLLEIDNQAAIAVAKSQSQTKKSKYIDVRYHFIQEAVQNGTIELVHTSSSLLQADALTKPLRIDKYTRHAAKLGLAAPLIPYPRL